MFLLQNITNTKTSSSIFNTESTLRQFSVVFSGENKLKLVHAPREIVDLTENLLSSCWTLLDVKNSDGLVEFILSDKPWYPTADTGINIKCLLCLLIKNFYAAGWHVKVYTKFGLNKNEMSSVIFERNIPTMAPIICVSLDDSNIIRILGPDSVIPIVKEAASQTWPFGIEKEFPSGRSWEIHMNGSPWSERTSDESFYSTLMVNGIIESLYKQGWLFTAAIKSSKTDDLNSLYFRYDGMAAQIGVMKNIFALSIYEHNKIRLAHASIDTVAALRLAIQRLWTHGIEDEKKFDDGYEFRLHQCPWWDIGEAGVESKRLISGILSFLRQYNWNLYGVCDLSKQRPNQSTLFFRIFPSQINQMRTFCLTLNGIDKMRVINAYQNEINCVRYSIRQSLQFDIIKENLFGGSWELQLDSEDKTSLFEKKNTMSYILMMMHIVNNLNFQGPAFLASINNTPCKYSHHGKQHYENDLFSWYFIGQF